MCCSKTRILSSQLCGLDYFGKWAPHRDGRLELIPNGAMRNGEIIFIESLAKDVLHLRRLGKRDLWIKNP